MGELLQAIRTFAMLRESDTSIEEGQAKEFLRGTFSIMDFDENCKEQLDQLKAKFMNFRKEVGGLDIQEFEEALRPMISRGVSQNQILTTFQKMDPCDEGAVTWNDFMNFAIEEHNKRLQMRQTMDEMPFGTDVLKIKHCHRDPIMRITFMPTVDPNTKFIDWGYGKYMILSREGLLSVWSSRMKLQGYYNLQGHDKLDPSWWLDLVPMYHNGFIATATTGRDLSFFDYTRQGWSRKYWLTKLEHCVTVMSYWAGLANELIAVLLWGDTSGGVNMLEFDIAGRVPLFGINVREGCNTGIIVYTQENHTVCVCKRKSKL